MRWESALGPRYERSFGEAVNSLAETKKTRLREYSFQVYQQRTGFGYQVGMEHRGQVAFPVCSSAGKETRKAWPASVAKFDLTPDNVSTAHIKSTAVL